MGRKRVDPSKKRTGRTITLPPDLWQWVDAKDTSRSKLIERLVREEMLCEKLCELS